MPLTQQEAFSLTGHIHELSHLELSPRSELRGAQDIPGIRVMLSIIFPGFILGNQDLGYLLHLDKGSSWVSL